MDVLSEEIDQLKKIVSELMLNKAMMHQQSQKRIPSNQSNQTRGSSVKRILPNGLNLAQAQLNESTLSFADR